MAKRSHGEAELRDAKKPKPAATSAQRWKMRSQPLNAYDRHKMLINTYQLTTKGSTAMLARDTSRDRNDYDIIRENHRFLWNDSDLADTWETNLAKRYYAKLFKEYCIADLTKYESNRFAFRWRTEKEVQEGRGQFTCGNKHCDKLEDLATWEVNFSYTELGESRNALVKLRLCPDCSLKLNFHTKKRQIKKERKTATEEKQHHSREGKKKQRRRHGTRGESPEHNDPTPPTTAPSTSNAAEAEAEKPAVKPSKAAEEIWTKKTTVADADKTLENEFDEFIDDLLM